MAFYAHSTDGNKSEWQTVFTHLTNTANLALELGEDSTLGQYAYIAAMLHDIGKYSSAFQRRLEGSARKVDHSTAGAKEVRQLFNDDPIKRRISEMLSYCIAGHHGGLLDLGSPIDVDTDGTLQGRLKKQVEDYSNYRLEINVNRLTLPNGLPIKPITVNGGFTLAFFTRMVYSILVDADFIDTETFMNHGKKPRGGYADIKELCSTLNQFLEKFDHPDNSINRQRTSTLKTCVAKAAEKPGLFTLTVPTGGGKTYASLAFALNHAATHGLKRIIYVIPYTSIIDQNAAIFKNCLGVENVLEHHSNFDWDQKNQPAGTEACDDKTHSAPNKLKLASENWDIPVVVTTNVQFFESLFANRSSRCRKLHNIAKSVIIFDEAQMFPRGYMKPSLYAVYELVKNYGASAIFCTATQPSLERFLPHEAILTELISDPQALFDFYKRVQVKNIGKITDAELIQRINDSPQVLCIVNTRKHARGLFTGITHDGRFHLSTLMCPMHRKEIIAIIRQRLIDELPCRVISTQIMEAGIDVDFPVGYRAISGLDSIIQAAGRVNREQKVQSGDLYVFEPESEFVKRTPAYIKQGAEVAKNILRKYGDPVCTQAVTAYYAGIYDLQDEHAFDQKCILDCFEKGIPGEPIFDFKTAAEEFKVIDNPTVAVIIPYNEEAREILQAARDSEFPLSFSRKLQLYTVNIFEQEFEALQAVGALDRVADTYDVLNNTEKYYDSNTGLAIPDSTGGEAIFP